MKKHTLNVKDKSVHNFLNEHCLNEELGRALAQGGVSAYHLMGDALYFKKNCGLKEGESILIQLKDRSLNSKKDLINNYWYTAEKYDDISFKMVLDDFKIEAVESADGVFEN